MSLSSYERSLAAFRARGRRTTAAAVLGSLAFLVGTVAADTRNTLYGCQILIASYPLYRLARKHATISPPS